MPKAIPPIRIPRPLPELVGSLRQNLELLRECGKRAFEERDTAYLGEVAGKLRVLVLDRGTNTPLLLEPMYEFDVNVEVTLRGPGYGDPLLLDEYLDSLAFCRQNVGRVRNAHKRGRGRHRNLGSAAGAAHEDWAVDESFVRFARSGISIGEVSAGAATLRAITRTVLSAADDFLEWLTDERLNAYGAG